MQGLRLSSGSRPFEYVSQTNQGLWPLIMTCVTLRSLKNPDAPANVLGFGMVLQRWYPLSLAAGLSLMGGSVQWDSFAAILFGHLYDVAWIEQRLLPSCARVQQIERRLPQRVL